MNSKNGKYYHLVTSFKTKRYLLIPLLLIATLTLKCSTKDNQKEDSRSLEDFDLTYFVGKPVGDLLSHPLFKDYKQIYFEDEPPGVLQNLTLEYADSTIVEIYISEYQYTKKFNETLTWPLDDLRKEVIDTLKFVDE